MIGPGTGSSGWFGAQKAGLDPTDIISPMKSVSGSTVRIDNANTFTLPDPFVSADIDTENYNGFVVPKLSAPLAMLIPTGSRQGRKITFTITQETTTRAVTWTGGAGGYVFATGASAVGVTVTQFNTLLAAMTNGQTLIIGFEYRSTQNAWLAVGLSGPY